MEWFQWISLVFLALSLIILMGHLIQLIRLGNPIDYAQPAGKPGSGIRYSFTKAMDPRKKESAYLHLPTYAAGLIYHLGTFLCILLFILSFFPAVDLLQTSNLILKGILSSALCISAGAGLFILIKRMVKPLMRKLSNPDDYASNLLVTLFQTATLGFLWLGPEFAWIYYLLSALLLLYLPVGKLKHLIYFFAARYHLGWFYGFRGTWPGKQNKSIIKNRTIDNKQ